MGDLIHQNLVFIITGIGIAIIGIIIQQSRSYSMIAGYNTMSAEKRKKVNIGQVAIALRNTFILLGLVWIIIPIIGDAFGFHKLKIWLLLGLHFVILAILIIVINTKAKYKIKSETKTKSY